MTDLSELGKLIDVLRAKGVTRYEDGPLKLELAAAPRVAEQPTDAARELLEQFRAGAPKLTRGKCACSHILTRHRNGVCVEGCTPLQCMPDAELKKARS